MVTYGYIGLGKMGSAMVERLLGTGAEVTVFDLDDAAVAALVGRGARAAASSAGVAATADVISICVPAAHHLAAVLSGPGGIAESARPGQVILIHSTVGPDTIRSAAATTAPWGVATHDACVAGGTDAARTGELVILAGGLSTLPPPAAAVLSIYGSKVIDGGPIGSGAALKLAFNVMTYGQFAAGAAAFDIVRRAEGATQSLVDAWRHVGQLGSLTESFLPLLSIPPEHVRGAFREYLLQSASLADKDLDLAADAIGASGARLPFITSLAAAMPGVFGVAVDQPEPPGDPR